MTPTVITSTVLKLKLFHFEIILAASIYTEQDKVEYNLYITQISARAPITSSMVNSKLDYADNPQAALTFDDTSFKSLKSAFLFLVNPIAYILGDVGQYYMWFMSFLLFLVMLKVAAEGFYHILLQYSTDGCGTWCLLAWLRTCWNVAKAPVALNDAAVERLVDDNPTQDHIHIEMTDMALPSRDIEQERRDFDPQGVCKPQTSLLHDGNCTLIDKPRQVPLPDVSSPRPVPSKQQSTPCALLSPRQPQP